MKKNIFKYITTDFRFWLIIFFVFRLYGITSPPLEVAHNWRQSTVSMVTRNFYETDSNILYPRVDMAGEKSGITGMEFPLLSYIAFLIAKLFGYSCWYERLINLIISSIGTYYFYLLIRKYFNERMALLAGLILICSLWLTYSRKIMPDTMSVSLVLIGLYYGIDFLLKGNFLRLLLYSIFTGSGILAKIPALSLLAVICIPFFSKKTNLSRRILISLFTVIIICITTFWYFYWVSYLNKTFQYQHFFMGKSISEGMIDIVHHFFPVLKTFYAYTLSYTGFVLFIAGIFLIFIRKNRLLIILFFLITLPFLLYMLKAGEKISSHSYYAIPYIPLMALIASYLLDSVKIRWVAIILISIVLIENILNRYIDFRIKDTELYKLEIETIADRFTKRNDIIAINGGFSPQDIYFTHRKGWTLQNEEIINTHIISELKAKNCKFLFINKHRFISKVPDLKYQKLFENEDYCIYRL